VLLFVYFFIGVCPSLNKGLMNVPMKLQELIFYLVHKRLQPETSNVMMTMSTLQALSGMPGMGGRCIYYSEVEPGW